MSRKIVVPIDGSPASEAVFPQLRGVLKRHHADVVLVRAIDLPAAQEIDYPVVLASLMEGAEKEIKDTAARLAADGITARYVIREGPAAQTILDVADEEGAWMILMSTHGRTGLSRWVFGSIAEKVLRSSKRPVLLTRSFVGGKAVTTSELPLRKILVPVDGSDRSLAVLPVLIDLVKPLDSSAVVLHVVPESQGGLRWILPEAPLQRATEELTAGTVPATRLVRRGDPAHEILEAARETGCDLIAMCTHGRSGPTRWVLGSVTEKVLREANVPVLVIRNPK